MPRKSNEISWQSIAARDPFLAGSIAARGWELWDEANAESEADSVGLSGEARAKFLAGWQWEMEEAAKARQGSLVREYDEMAKDADKGDPARQPTKSKTPLSF